MAIRVHFVGGDDVTLDGESLTGFEETLGGPAGGVVRYPQDSVVIVLDKVTYVEDLDADMPTVEESSY